MTRNVGKKGKTQKKKTTNTKRVAAHGNAQKSHIHHKETEESRRGANPFSGREIMIPPKKKRFKPHANTEEFDELKRRIKYTEDVTSIGISAKNLFDLNEKVCNLLRPRHLKILSKRLDITLNEAGNCINLTRAMLSNRQEHNKLNLSESESLVRVGRIFDRVTLLFGGDLAEARAWVKRKSNDLKGYSPIELCKTEIGGKIIENHINKLLY